MKRQEDHRDFIFVCYSHNPQGDLDKEMSGKKVEMELETKPEKFLLKQKKSATKNRKSAIPRTNKWYGANNT